MLSYYVNLCDDTHHLIVTVFQNRPAGDQRGPCGRLGASEHRVGDPWDRTTNLLTRLT